MRVLLLALLVLGHPAADPQSSQACSPAALLGTWQIAKGTIGGEATPTGPNDPIEYKHLTPTHFIVYQVTKEGTMNWAHGGPYTLAGDTYTESIQHGFGEPYKGLGRVSVSFKCSMEGKDTWRISGSIANTTLDETWTRVTGARASQ
jgi:hypothetical protein